MKFVLIQADHSSEYTEYIISKLKPFEMAYEESFWKQESHLPKKGFSLVAELNKKGKPVIVQKPFVEKPPKQWFKEGRNHRSENDIYFREIESTAWFIDIDTIEALIDFLKQNEGEIWTDGGFIPGDVPHLVYEIIKIPKVK